MNQNENARAERLFLLIKPIVLWRSRCRCRPRCLSSLIDQCGRDQETSSCLSHVCAACSDAANKMLRQPTSVGKFCFTKSIEHRGSQRNKNK